MAELTCWRIARTPMLALAIPTITSRRLMASRGLLAWMVVSDPSWPVFIAWSMSSASAPRTSPTMMRSGRMRRLLITRSRCVIRARLEAYDVVLAQQELGRVLDRHDPLVVGDEARDHVEQRRLAGARAARDE